MVFLDVNGIELVSSYEDIIDLGLVVVYLVINRNGLVDLKDHASPPPFKSLTILM